MDEVTEGILGNRALTPALKITFLRQEKLWSQDEFAKKAKISLRTVWSMENRDGVPKMGTRRKVLKALGIPPALHRRIWPEG